MIGHLLQDFYGNHVLVELNLSTNNIQGSEGGRIVRDFLENNLRLKKLSLWNNRLGPEGAEALAPGLTSNHSLESLELGICKLGDEGVTAIVNALTTRNENKESQRSGIRSLDLHANELTRRALSDLTALLSSPTSPRIEALDVSHTPDLLRDPERVQAFANALKSHEYLQRLDLRESGMNDEASKWLFPALETSPAIESVNFFSDRGQLGPVGRARLVKSLPKLQPRQLICHAPFWSNADEILKALDQNIHLEVLYGIRMLGNDKHSALSLILGRNKTMTRVTSLIYAPTRDTVVPTGLWPLALAKVSNDIDKLDGVTTSSAIYNMLIKSVVQWI